MTNRDGEHNSRGFSSRSIRHGGLVDKDAAGCGSRGKTFAPGSNSSPSGQGHHCSVHATAASSKARGTPAWPAKGTLPEAQSVGTGWKDCQGVMVELCPCKIPTLKSSPSVPQNMTLFGNKFVLSIVDYSSCFFCPPSFWWIRIRGLCNTLANWCEEPTHQKRPWCWESLKAKGGEGARELDGWIASFTQ